MFNSRDIKTLDDERLNRKRAHSSVDCSTLRINEFLL